MELIRSKVSPVVEELDLRKIGLEFRDSAPKKEQKRALRARVKEAFLRIMKGSGVLLLNIDDSDCVYDNLYDPDLTTIFGGRVVYQSMWTPELMLQKNVWTSYAGREEAIPAAPYTVSLHNLYVGIDSDMVEGTGGRGGNR